MLHLIIYQVDFKKSTAVKKKKEKLNYRVIQHIQRYIHRKKNGEEKRKMEFRKYE